MAEPLSQGAFDLWREGDTEFKDEVREFMRTQVSTNTELRQDLHNHEQSDLKAMASLEAKIVTLPLTAIKWLGVASGAGGLGFVVDFFKNHWR